MNLWINECPTTVKVCVHGTTSNLPIPSLEMATPCSVSRSKSRGGPRSHIELSRNVLYVCLLRPQHNVLRFVHGITYIKIFHHIRVEWYSVVSEHTVWFACSTPVTLGLFLTLGCNQVSINDKKIIKYSIPKSKEAKVFRKAKYVLVCRFIASFNKYYFQKELDLWNSHFP